MDAMMTAAPAGMVAPSHEFLYQLQHLQQQQQQHQMHQQGMVAAAYGYPGGGIQSMVPGFASPFMAPPMIPRVSSNASMLDDATARSFSGPLHASASTYAPSPVASSTEAPPAAAAVAPQLTTSAPLSSGDEDAAGLMERLDKKDQMINQLGSFLSQMKQESEGTASAWKEKLQEIAELKRQLAATTQQLAESRDKERETATQLKHAQQTLETATEAQRATEQTHIEELTIMHDEIKKRESEAEHMKIGYEQSLKDVSHELLEAQQRQQEAVKHSRTLEDALKELDETHQTALRQWNDERHVLQQSLESMNSHVESIDREKHELGQHLWNLTQELQQCKQREDELARKCTAAASELESAQSAWTERFHSFQSERAEQLGVHSMLQTQLQELDAQVQTERAQKEELNAMMVREIERFHADVAHLEHTHQQALTQALDEAEKWKARALKHEDALAQAETKLASARAEAEALETRLRTIDEENQSLQQHGSEKASTLQEMNNQLRGVLLELEDSQSRYEQLHAAWERHKIGLAKCLQVLASTAVAPPNSSSSSPGTESSSSSSGLTDAFPVRILNALDEYVQLSSSSAELKIALLRAQQELDSDRERWRQREHELTTQSQTLERELTTTRSDATALAHELQTLSRQVGGAESKLAAQVQQLTKELDDVRSTSGVQALQLQKSLDAQRARTNQLESEKKDLLQEAAQLNASLEALYQAKSEKQLELEQLRATWKELELEHSDLRESYDDLDDRSTRTIAELNARLKDVQTQAHTQRSQATALQTQLDQALAHASSLERDLDALSLRLSTEQTKWTGKEQELSAVLEDKTHRMDEMLEMLTQLQAKSEFLEKARASDDASGRQELERLQAQVLALSQDKKRLELAYSSLKTTHDQTMHDAFALREEHRRATQQQSESDDALSALTTDLARVKTELERAVRAKASLQAELHRASDDAQDAMRQLEVARRDARAQATHFASELERVSKDADELRTESAESSALVEELQAKMTSIQTAANATINDLMAELQHAQETIAFEKTRLSKENEQLRSQLKALDDDLRRRELELKDLQTAARSEKEQSADRENELMLRLSRATSVLEQKKLESDKLSKELEAKALKVAECERKLTPLVHAKESLQAKNTELKQGLDAKTRDAHDLEQRLRDDVARAVKEKRDVEALYVTLKDEFDSVRSQSSGQQHQWQSECKALKQSLERTKSELGRASADVLALSQRLEACQSAANETISDLSSRLDAADQQREIAVNALQRELHLERERRREAEVQKVELQRLVRQRGGGSGAPATQAGLPPAAMSDRASAWSNSSSGALDSDASAAQPPPKSAQPTTSSNNAATAVPKTQTLSAAAPEIRKFYANEPMTNTELSNLPMALIKAQLGLDLASAGSASSPVSLASAAKTSSPLKSSNSSIHARGSALPLADASYHLQRHQQENNDDIPPLPLEKLPQYVARMWTECRARVDTGADTVVLCRNPEADGGEGSPSCDVDSSGGRGLALSSSTAQHHAAALSSRSTERFFIDSTDGRNRLSGAGSSASSKISASGNNSKKLSSSKKKRVSGSSASSAAAAGLASAYASFGTLPSASSSLSTAAAHGAAAGSPQKSKSTSKLLPRIP